jgi:hypothetical protein
VTARTKAYVRGRLVARIAGSNPAAGIDVCLSCFYVVFSCVGRGLCDGPITRPEESYRVSNCERFRNTSEEDDKALIWAVVPYEKNQLLKL